MGFTQPCFIRKNTPELRKKLEEFGYIMGESLNTNKSKGLICTKYGKVFNIIFNADISKYDIDCGTNEELFLALAALRDDSDYMQWFTDGEKWVQNKQNDIEVIRYGACNPINFHKANVQELIEHFKSI